MSLVKVSGNASGTGTLTIAAPNTNSDYTLTLPQTTSTLGIDGPAFSAYLGSSQTVTSGVYAKVTLNTERFDTNSNFDSATNYRFTPTVAGYYQINYAVYGTASGAMTAIISALYKNGAVYEYGVIGSVTGNQQYVSSTLVSMNGSTDYLELYASVSGTGTVTVSASSGTTSYMSGSLVRSA